MRVLFISGELIAGDVAYRLKLEGCQVKLFVKDRTRRDCFDNMVEKTSDWKKELGWVGKNGLIVFDDVIFGSIPDDLRKAGYNVFGGTEAGSELEKNREFAQEIFSTYGMEISESKDFDNEKAAIGYIKRNRGKWVVKQNGHLGSFSYVGCLKDGKDVISIINSYYKHVKSDVLSTISLQKRVDGVEVAIARFFNGQEWNSPIFVSFEHKPFLNGDIGPLTAEMGTLAWYDDDENNKLFQATLAKIKPYLQKINYRGYVDINSIVHKKTLIPLEATMRFGSPTNQMQSWMQKTPWKNILWSTATGGKCKFSYRPGYTIVVAIAIPPFPYQGVSSDYYLKDVDILFKSKLSKEDLNRVHFEEVSMRKVRGNEQFYVTGNSGYILFIDGSGDTVEEARQDVYKMVEKIILPKMMYRTDIGTKFIQRDEKLLKNWGWI